MIGMIHNKPGEMPTLVGSMPQIAGLGNATAGVQLQGASGVVLEGPPGWEQAASTGSVWDRIKAKRYELGPAGLGAPLVHGQGLGAPLVHGMGLGGALGLSDDDIAKMAEEMAQNDMLTMGEIADAMKLLTKDERNAFGAQLIGRGVSASTVSAAKALADPAFKKRAVIWGVLGTISMGASAYHGYRRNDSIGWALWWGLMGAMFPVITPVIGLAQGFGQPKG